MTFVGAASSLLDYLDLHSCLGGDLLDIRVELIIGGEFLIYKRLEEA